MPWQEPWPIMKRLMSHVQKVEGGCWIWTGARKSKGYGSMRIGPKSRSRTVAVHRLMWAETHGPIPVGFCVLHHCDNPPCINPDHLWLGTNSDNILDKMRKGRTPNGELHWRARLKKEAARDIRSRFRALLIELSGKHGVSVETVRGVAAGKGWRSLDEG